MPPLLVWIPIVLGLLVVAVFYGMLHRKRANLGPELLIPAESLIRQAAEKAVARARTRFRVTLDYSLASISQVDDIFAKLRDLRARSPELIDVNSLAFVYGAYVGECIRRHHAGFLWHRESPTDDFQLHGKDAAYTPIEWCMQRLTETDAPTLLRRYEAIAAGPAKTRAAGAS